MRVVVQRVTEAQVLINQKISASIGKGLAVFVAFAQDDNEEKIGKMAQKIVKLRIFTDKENSMNLSLKQAEGDLLLVPQFTLYALLKGQNRPFFGNIAKGETAKNLFNQFIACCKKYHRGKVGFGEFGAFMQVNLTNDGPVTIIIDSTDL